MKANNWMRLILALLVCQTAGAVGALFTTPAIPTWYAGLVKPSFNPPNWIFGPVWTTLFLMMGVALFLVWRMSADSPGRSVALGVFIAQLVLNLCWSILFFGLKMPWMAFGEIILLWASILASMVLFFRLSRSAGWLMAPYLAWVSFASVLNFAIAKLNH